MTIKIAINGFGRIGRCITRAVYETADDKNENNQEKIELVAINATMSVETQSHLLKYDSIHGRFNKNVINDGDNLIIDGKKVALFNQRDPENLDWKIANQGQNIDVVMECTGAFTDLEGASKHLKVGTKK